MIILFDAHNDNQEETIRGQSVLFKGKVFKSKACIKIIGWRPTGPWKLMWTISPHHIRGGAPTCRNPNGPVTSPLVWPCHAAIVFNTYRIALSGQIIIIWLISHFFPPFKRLPFPICAWKLGFLEAQCFPPCISRDKGGPS